MLSRPLLGRTIVGGDRRGRRGRRFAVGLGGGVLVGELAGRVLVGGLSGGVPVIGLGGGVLVGELAGRVLVGGLSGGGPVIGLGGDVLVGELGGRLVFGAGIDGGKGDRGLAPTVLARLIVVEHRRPFGLLGGRGPLGRGVCQSHPLPRQLPGVADDSVGLGPDPVGVGV